MHVCPGLVTEHLGSLRCSSQRPGDDNAEEAPSCWARLGERRSVTNARESPSSSSHSQHGSAGRSTRVGSGGCEHGIDLFESFVTIAATLWLSLERRGGRSLARRTVGSTCPGRQG